MLTTAAALPAVTTWYFDDSGVTGWGQNGWANPPQWEWMDAGPLAGTLPYYDLDPQNPYYACSAALTADFSGFHFWADIWFANNYPGALNADREVPTDAATRGKIKALYE